MYVLNPIAPIAIIIKNLDKSLSGTNTSAGTPTAVAIVVIKLAPIKKRIKNGTGNATFRTDLIDAVFNLTEEELTKGARYEIF